MSPLLKSVEKAGVKGLTQKRNPFSISSADFFSDSELLRSEFVKLINIKQSNRIAIIPSVSYGMANAVRNIKLTPDQNVIVASEQFPSNYYPWLRLCEENHAQLNVVGPPAIREGRGKEWNQRILESINGKTRVVTIGNVHWTDGTRFDLQQIRKRTRDVGALLIVDGTQSVGALPFDVGTLQPDALICAGYKWLMGPYSIGLAYYGEHFDNGTPIEESWINRFNSEDFTGLVNYQSRYQPGALRYDVGEHSNFIGVPMLLQALKQINEWKPARIQEYCQKISRDAIRQLRALGYWIEDESQRGHHLFGIRLPDGAAVDPIKKKLAQKNIAVSFRGDSIRVAPHLYNTAADLEKLVKALTP
ncbi:MAG: aminotransferase class V-fold PLP-dependent enzyme [Bacteroidota bacterium]